MLGGKSTNLDRSVGSKVTSSAMSKAANVSTGSTAASSPPSSSTVPSRSAAPSAPRRTIHPGSKAGLNIAKPVHLNMNGVGYLNPANQTARLKDRSKAIDISVNNRIVDQKINRVTFDSRLTSSKTSSISRINKRS